MQGEQSIDLTFVTRLTSLCTITYATPHHLGHVGYGGIFQIIFATLFGLSILIVHCRISVHSKRGRVFTLSSGL